jgi:hypothetical protein
MPPRIHRLPIGASRLPRDGRVLSFGHPPADRAPYRDGLYNLRRAPDVGDPVPRAKFATTGQRRTGSKT